MEKLQGGQTGKGKHLVRGGEVNPNRRKKKNNSIVIVRSFLKKIGASRSLAKQGKRPIKK